MRNITTAAVVAVILLAASSVAVGNPDAIERGSSAIFTRAGVAWLVHAPLDGRYDQEK